MPSNPTSPSQDLPFLPQFPTSPIGNASSYFASDINNRDRSFSNRSTRSSQYGSDFLDTNRLPPLQLDLSELLGETKPRPGSDGNGFLHHGGRRVLSPFQRAVSRGSGTGSGSGGSGSGTGSPHSSRD
ncbi:hypothetical protein N7519_004579 [Penicillium mononematosum]|nr:uncharacterized protein N7519_004579 [Penicillium mononematosum]KAJ6189671.1 hypothetical protein N7519_004579 [Penicillium mononematosum]